LEFDFAKPQAEIVVEIVALVTMQLNHEIDGLINLANGSHRSHHYMTSTLLNVLHDPEHNGHWKPLM